MAETPEAVYQALGARIRMMRDMLGIDQLDLATRIGLTRASIANVETGRQRIRVDQVEAIAKAFGTTPRALMKGIWW